MAEDEMVGWQHQLNGRGLSRLREFVIDREAWHAAVYGVAKSWTWLRALGKEQKYSEPMTTALLNFEIEA